MFEHEIMLCCWKRNQQMVKTSVLTTRTTEGSSVTLGNIKSIDKKSAKFFVEYNFLDTLCCCYILYTVMTRKRQQHPTLKHIVKAREANYL